MENLKSRGGFTLRPGWLDRRVAAIHFAILQLKGCLVRCMRLCDSYALRELLFRRKEGPATASIIIYVYFFNLHNFHTPSSVLMEYVL